MADVPTTSALNVEHWSAALSVETRRRQTFGMGLTGQFTKSQLVTRMNERVQSNANMPFMRISDLRKTAGDTVHFQMRHMLGGKPTMGGRNLEGRGRDIRYVNQSLRIDQTRHAAKRGNTMAQKRTKHGLREDAMDELADYFARMNDQECLVHVCGARGYQESEDWIVPLESDEEFAEIMINPVMPPTRNRRFFAGNASTVGQVGVPGTGQSPVEESDFLGLETLDNLRAWIADMAFPPTPVKLDGDGTAAANPFYIIYMGPRVWRYLKAKVGEGSMRNFVAAAYARKAAFPEHPIFLAEMGNMFVWEGFLCKRMDYSIRFPMGSIVREMQADGSISDVETMHDVERSFLLGGQALAVGEGSHPESGLSFFWNEEEYDHRDKLEVAAGQIEGKQKFRFKGTDGQLTDKGVITIDSYAPDPLSDAGRKLINALNG